MPANKADLGAIIVVLERLDGIGKPVGHGVPRCLVQRSREVSASDFDVAPLLSASDVFDRHFCDAFAVAIDEFYKVSINVVLLKPLVQTHALDDLNRAAADIDRVTPAAKAVRLRSEEHTSELQSLMRISYAVFCLKKKN